MVLHVRVIKSRYSMVCEAILHKNGFTGVPRGDSPWLRQCCDELRSQKQRHVSYASHTGVEGSALFHTSLKGLKLRTAQGCFNALSVYNLLEYQPSAC